MLRLVLVLALLLVASASAQQTFCQKYAAAVFGADTLENEIALINATVMYAFGQLYADPATREWFNGQSNPNRIDFGTNTAAAGLLVNHLIAYFGSALGCTASGFSTQYPVATTNMTAVHAAFPKPITKVAYERFNQIIIDFLVAAGVSPTDTYAVASVLDGFRSPPASGPNNNQVCQATDCNTSPFSVRVYDTYLNPPYISVPAGVAVSFEPQSANTVDHALRSTTGAQPSSCSVASSPLINVLLPAGTTTPVLSSTFQGLGPLNYADTGRCSQGMYGTVNLIVPPPASQTFCQKYAAAVFGADTLENEIALINATVMYAFGQLYADPTTSGWFNGQFNPGAIDFGTNGAAATNLVKHLIGFFGAALGCTASGFSTQYPVAATNMTAVHSNFPTPINKAAYERFNQIILEFLAVAGVTQADRYVVAQVLDGFRTPPLVGPNTNQVCQAADCQSAPFQVLVQDNFFNPPYVSVPDGGSVQFVKKAGRTHNVVQTSSPSTACSAATSPLFSFNSFSAGVPNITTTATTPPLTGGTVISYASTTATDCSFTGMYGGINVLRPISTASIIVGEGNQASFTPANISLNAPVIVTWTWSDANTKERSVTSEDPSRSCTRGGPQPFDSGSKRSGTFEVIFPFGGTYPYYSTSGCNDGMRGTLSIAGPAAPAPSGSGVANNCYTNPNGVMTICWKVNGDSIEFTVTGKTLGWIATGISDDENMPQSDIFWGQVDSQGPVIIDRYADARAQPPMDAQQDLRLDTGRSGESGGVTTLVFTRLLRTQPPDDRDVDIENRDYFLMWAYSNVDATRTRKRNGIQPDQFSFQQHITSGTARVNFFSGGAVTAGKSDKLRKAHGIIMIFAWMISAVMGAFIARYFKALMGGGWFTAHRILQWLAVLLNLIGFILIVVWVNRQGTKHFRAPHQRLGLVIFIMSIIQPLLGILADKFFDPKRREAPFFPDMIHWLVGYTVIILGLVNIWLGMNMYCVTTVAAIMYGLVYAVIVGGFFAFEMMRLLTDWGGFLGSHGADRGEPKPLIAAFGAILAILLLVFSIVIIAEIGKENAANPDPYFDACLIPELVGRQYWIRLTIYIVVAFTLGIIAAFIWIFKSGSRSGGGREDAGVAYRELPQQ